MTAKTPPQLIILAIIAKNRDGITVKDLVSYISYLHKHGIDTGYQVDKSSRYGVGISKELLLDINVLKVMHLVKEENGMLVASDKAHTVLKKYSECDSVIKFILTKT